MPPANLLQALAHSRLLSALADALFPPRCRACGVLLETRPSGSLASGISDARGPYPLEGLLCGECALTVQPVASPLCPVCGTPFLSPEGADRVCDACRQAPPRYSRARAWGVYQGALKDLIHGFKYRHRTALAKPFGVMLLHTLRSHWKPGEVDVIHPVPLHPARARRRGFNQAGLVLRHGLHAAGRACNRQSVPPVREDLLARVRKTPPQTGLDRRARRRNVKGAFKLRDAGAVHSQTVLLVDDVLTTGATINECARLLLDGGAARVDVLTLARAVKPRGSA